MLQVELPQIGPYAPVRPLGEGSTTYTYLYRHEQRKKYVAMKLTRAPLTTSEAKEAFLERAKRLKKLKHRNIVEIQDAGLLASGTPSQDYGYLAMQYTEGKTVRERFQAGSSYPSDEVKRVLSPLADALQYAHTMHVVHGNLHPGNVLQEGTKEFFLLGDFSLASSTLANSELNPPHISEALRYYAPEQLKGPATAASDQYALAAMAYEWLSGHCPYPATAPEELLFQQEHNPLPTLSNLNPQIKPRVEEVILRALSLDPGERFPKIMIFADAYLHALMGLPYSIPATSASTSSSAIATQKLSDSTDQSPSIDDSSRPSVSNTPISQTRLPDANQHELELSPLPVATNQATSEIIYTVTSQSKHLSEDVTPAPSLPTTANQDTSETIYKVNRRAATPAEIEATHTPRTTQPSTLTDLTDLQRRVEADLRQGGALSRSLTGYEERPAQIEMAMLVARSISDGAPAILEAPTGTGKSLSYLIPAVRSNKVAIISTANKALQEQLFYKDIPFVQRYIRQFDAALVKGMGNYICLDRLEQERIGIQHYVKNRDFQRVLERMEEGGEDFAGDFETLGFPLNADIRSKINADRDQCTWSKCSYFSDCYVRKMKVRASQANIIVVNHTLLLLDALMEGYLLPERDVIVIDEAHHLEEEATRAFTVTISQGQIATLLAQHALKNHTPPSLQEETKETMVLAWDRLFLLADPGSKGRINLKEPLQEGLGLATMVTKLADALRTGRPKDMPEKEDQLYDKLLTRTQNLAENIRTVFSVNQLEKYVYYVERATGGGRRGSQQLEVSAAPLTITSWLKEHLFDKSNVICTSATLATIGPDPAKPDVKGPNFAYFRRRVGLDVQDYPNTQESILPLTFDYESHALLYLPRHLPEPAYGTGPAAQAYTMAIAQEMMRLVEISHGRAFLLFSSKRMLDEVYEIFQRELPIELKFPLLRQGDMNRMELVRNFREREGAVLFGLKSFWEGVDIVGEALSLVVIDKLPFDPPDDPVHEARVAQMKAAGENWFGIYVLPQTVLRLKQGLGRLLRTRDDRGVMAILDTRLHTKPYGRQIVMALPPAKRTAGLSGVTRFFDPPEDDDEAPF